MMEIFATEARRLKLHGIPHSRKREKKKKSITLKMSSSSRSGAEWAGERSRGAISFLDLPRKIKGLYCPGQSQWGPAKKSNSIV